MPWQKTPAGRAADARNYGPEYRRNRAVVMRRAGGRCEQCGARARLQCDHVIPVSQGGTHAVTNLRGICGPCHTAKTATEGGGYRARTGRHGGDPDPAPDVWW